MMIKYTVGFIITQEFQSYILARVMRAIWRRR
jgi:hypothetical protein